MKFNFKNRVRNFKFSTNEIFVPLHEAIMNSIQSIEEKGNFEEAFIHIRIERDSYRIAGFTSGIFAIEIVDNGIGFVTHNYESFCTSDSDYKVEIGGKGVGRINWLKAFEMVDVQSVYEENQTLYERHFRFNVDDEIHDETIQQVDEQTPIQTKITLINLKPDYRSATEISLKEIALKVIEHFATYFVIGAMPKIIIEDEIDQINLNEFFEKEKFIETKNEIVTSNNKVFNIRHVFLNASPNAKHKIYICAQNRVVCSYDVMNIEDLPSTFLIEDKKAIYQCYVHGEFLDNDVNSERTYFSNIIFEQEQDSDKPHFELAINLYEAVYNQIHTFLMGYLEPMREIRDSRISEYIEHYSPQYKYLEKYAKKELQNISYTTASNPEKLAAELDKLGNKFNLKHKHQIGKTLQDASEQAKDKLLSLVGPLSENLRSEFANFVFNRHATVDIFERILALEPTLEDIVQQFFLIQKEATSDETNLWLVDERLSYRFDCLSFVDPSFVCYVNEQELVAIAIYFVDPKQIRFHPSDNPVASFQKQLKQLHINQTMQWSTYIIVSDAFGLISEGWLEKDMMVFTYQDMIERAKRKEENFK